MSTTATKPRARKPAAKTPGRKPLPTDEQLVSRGVHLRRRQWTMLQDVLDKVAKEKGDKVTQREFFGDFVERQHRKFFPHKHAAERSRTY